MVRKKANRPFGLIFKYLREFSKFWFEYISVFIGTTLAITFVIIPLLESISGLIMRLSGIPYVSYNNLGNLIQNHFLGVLGLLIILFLLIFLVYVQFIVQFKGIRLIQSRSLTLKNLFKEVVSSAKKVKIQQLGFFLFYFLLIIPFMILKGQPLKLAIKESLKRTKGVRKFFRLSVYFGLIGLFSIIMQGLLCARLS